ncbi:MAG: hypothetical protein VX569_11220 [Pseudomonadota bacterium]|nr:hypothetical protein [Pseudomonadota bacterium]
MEDVATAIYACMVLAVPFLFGLAIGRGIRRPKPTLEHAFGSRVIAAIHDVRSRRQFVGEGMIVSNTMRIQLPDARAIDIEIRERT